jgi:hypothetical protein
MAFVHFCGYSGSLGRRLPPFEARRAEFDPLDHSRVPVPCSLDRVHTLARLLFLAGGFHVQ